MRYFYLHILSAFASGRAMKHWRSIFTLLFFGVSLGVIPWQCAVPEAMAANGPVTGVSPSNAVLNVPTRFVVTGIALPNTLAFAVADAECTKVSGSVAQAIFNCIPRAAGNKSYVVKDKPGGTLLASGMIQIGGVIPTPVPQPQPVPVSQPAMNITAASPAAALMLNQQATFNLSGSNLTTGQIRISLTNCDGGSIQVFSATQARFSCTPRAAGTQRLFWKRPGSETEITLAQFNVGQPAPQPAPPQPVQQAVMNIAAANPAMALMLNQPATFNLSGSNLTAGQLRISLTNCDGGSIQVLSATQARFSCTPRAAGAQRLFWKRPDSETEITLAQFNVGQPAPQPVAPQPTTQQPAPSQPAPVQQAVMNITAASPAAALMLNQPATFNLSGSNLTAGQLRISLTNCDGGSIQVLSATQARFSCTPRAAGAQRLFWKRPDSETEITLAQFNVGQPAPQSAPPQSSSGQLSADPNGMWRNWQSGAAAVKTPQLRDGKASTLSPAEIIYYSAQENGTNPVTIISKLQGEQGLIEGNYAGEDLRKRLELATGYGARVGEKWFGFYPQVVGLSYQFNQFAQQKLTFAVAYQTYTQDARGPFSQFQSLYAKYATALNRIAGTNYPVTPGDQGYYRDFMNVGPQAIQSLLQQMGGTLGNARLFGGGNVIGAGVISTPAVSGSNAYSVQSIAPLSGTVGQKVTFTVAGNVPGSMVINLQGERCYNESKPAPNQVVCDVTRSGSNPQLEVKDMAGGQVLRTFSFEGKIAQTVAGKIAAPLASLTVTQKFGNYLGTYGGVAYNGYHTGTDLRGGRGTPVFAIANGTVSRAAVAAASGNANTLGWYVVIEHPALNARSVYVHTDRPSVAVGSQVQAGQQIATLGAPTQVPSHLHLEIQRLDKKVINSRGDFTPFVGKSTTPVGNNGYAARRQDLDAIWLDPEQFLKGTVSVKADISGAGLPFIDGPQDISGHTFTEDTQKDDPPVTDQVSRQQVLNAIASFAAAKKIAQSQDISEMQRLGIFRGATLSRPAEPASRMEVALMAQRLLLPLNIPGVNSGARFSIEEFGSTPEAAAQEYQMVVNSLHQWGIINGQLDNLGSWRFYPTRKISRSELDEIMARMQAVVLAVPNMVPANSAQSAGAGRQNSVAAASTVSISVSNPNPVVGEKVSVNLDGALPVGQASDIYLYMKVAQLGGQVTWYYDKRFNDDVPRPWRSNVPGPAMPETNPIFQYAPRVPGAYSVGVLIVPAGNPVNFSFATERAFNVGSR